MIQKAAKLWVIYDKVYDLKDFLILHPGGVKIVAKYAGITIHLLITCLLGINFIVWIIMGR